MDLKEQVNLAALEVGIKDAYRKFLGAPMPDGFVNYSFDDQDVIVEVFHFDPVEDAGSSLYINDEDSVQTLMTFGVGKVLASGPLSKYTKGDIVKLKDYETATVENPVFSQWKEAVSKRPVNTKVNTAEPAKKINNLLHFHQDKIFVVNPIKATNDYADYFTFRFHDGHIVAKIVNPHGFLD